MMQYSTPFLFLLIVGAFKSMDPALEESSRMSGASAWTTFRRVTLGLMLPVTTSAFLLSFIRGVESFESALIFGSPVGHRGHHHRDLSPDPPHEPPDYPQATALALGIMVLMFALVAWQWRLLGGRSFFTVTGKGYTPRVARLGSWRWVTFGFCVLFFVVTVVLPVGQLIVELVLQVLRLLPDEHGDDRALPGRLAEPAGLARARQHAAARPARRHRHHAAGRR